MTGFLKTLLYAVDQSINQSPPSLFIGHLELKGVYKAHQDRLNGSIMPIVSIISVYN
jgi:hypothetical protein